MDPIAFEIGPLVFRWYGLLIVGGALIAAWLASREAQYRGQNPEHVWDVFVWALLGGILGARLYHVLS
ncbi:MAG: prolipoprotein diacylglyceryl transferase, partial [Chloroflexota bacterium]|nr:prolipoprotein diacylglyceryl transferase [Chloroflexota bacterium]